jgi:hypothetical protein
MSNQRTPHPSDDERDTGNSANRSQTQEQANGNVIPAPRQEKSGNVAEKRPYASGNKAGGLGGMSNDPNRSCKRR